MPLPQPQRRKAWFLREGLLVAIAFMLLGALASYWAATRGQGTRSLTQWSLMATKPATIQRDCPLEARSPGARIQAEHNMTYETCLRAHGRPLDAEFRSEWYEAAKKSTGKARLDAMARHLVAGWLNTLERGRGTPCRPLMVRWRCSNEARCGGIGDRINGIQTAFWMAVITHSVFILDWTRPVELTEFFLPVEDELAFDSYRDCLTTRNLRWTSYSPGVASAQRRNKTAIEETLKAAEAFSAAETWSRFDAVDVLCNKGYLPYVMRSMEAAPALARYGLEHSTVRDLLYICNRLWMSRPSPRLAAAAAPRLARMADRARIGIHVRYGDAALQVYGPSSDVRYDAGAATCWVKQAVQQCHAMNPRPCFVFLTTDTDEAVATIQHRLKSHGIESLVVPGAAAHIDRQVDVYAGSDHEELVGSLEKDFLDWYLLSQMEVLILSTSGFSASAAYSALPVVAVALPKNSTTCKFTDWRASCLGFACPGQMTTSRFAEAVWDLGSMDKVDGSGDAPPLPRKSPRSDPGERSSVEGGDDSKNDPDSGSDKDNGSSRDPGRGDSRRA